MLRVHRRGDGYIKTHRYGFGLMDLFRGPRKGAPPAVRKFLADHPNRKIVSLSVGRKPINSYIAKTLNILTNGHFQKKQRQRGYDALNHTYVVFTLDNGERFRMEKDHVVGIKKYNNKQDHNLKDVEMKEPINVQDFISHGEEYGKKNPNHEFWKYDSQNSNCQYFVNDLVRGNEDKIENVQEVEAYYLQPRAGETVGPIKDLVRGITDLAALGDRIVHGTGVGRKRKRRCGGEDYYDKSEL
jgi:hypothetical protein